MTVTTENLISSDPAYVRAWLAKQNPRQFAELEHFELEVRLGRLSTSSTAVARYAIAGKKNGDINEAPSSEPFVKNLRKDRRLVTTRTVELLRSIVGSTKWKNPAELMLLLRGLGRDLNAVGGFREPAIGNVVRRLMCVVREETNTCSNVIEEEKQQPQQPVMSSLSLSSMLWALPQHVTVYKNANSKGAKVRSESISSVASDAVRDIDVEALPISFQSTKPELKTNVMEAIQEMKDELEDLHRSINEQAPKHIHADEVILTYARSKTIELFLKAAASKKRNFQVVICEGAPHFGGHSMAKSLASAGIDTTVINDAAIFAMMARVNKVLLPAHAVLANGGLIASSGSHLVSLAAKKNSVPVVAVTGLFKLCPIFPHDGQDTLNDLVNPSSVVKFNDADFLTEVEVVNPVHDYIPPQLVNCYVTNAGCFQPSYIYRLLSEYYHMDDWNAF